jgi:hypothetical protein
LCLTELPERFSVSRLDSRRRAETVFENIDPSEVPRKVTEVTKWVAGTDVIPVSGHPPSVARYVPGWGIRGN